MGKRSSVMSSIVAEATAKADRACDMDPTADVEQVLDHGGVVCEACRSAGGWTHGKPAQRTAAKCSPKGFTTWQGCLTKRGTYDFSVRYMSRVLHGVADVFYFDAADPRCKVTFAAVVQGLPLEVNCSQSGDVGRAVLRAAGLLGMAKNSGVNGDYDTFPDPIGCPADVLQQQGNRDHTVVTMTFYRK